MSLDQKLCTALDLSQPKAAMLYLYKLITVVFKILSFMSYAVVAFVTTQASAANVQLNM